MGVVSTWVVLINGCGQYMGGIDQWVWQYMGGIDQQGDTA